MFFVKKLQLFLSFAFVSRYVLYLNMNFKINWSPTLYNKIGFSRPFLIVFRDSWDVFGYIKRAAIRFSC